MGLKSHMKSIDSIKNAAAIAALNTMAKYTGNQTGHIPGKLPGEWAMGGMLFDTMIQYWYFTGDSSNNPAVSQGMYAQRGEQEDYFPANWSSWMGNDDQMQWGLAAMTAAELEFPQESSMPSWVTLAENVFNDMVPRWDNKTCGGGLRWQIYPYQSGYSIKSSASNGEFFQLAARLARYTNNQSYADWAERIWDWSTKSLLLNTNKWNLGDSLDATMDCSRGDAQWTYNYGAYISGAAYMYNVVSNWLFREDAS